MVGRPAPWASWSCPWFLNTVESTLHPGGAIVITHTTRVILKPREDLLHPIISGLSCTPGAVPLTPHHPDGPITSRARSHAHTVWASCTHTLSVDYPVTYTPCRVSHSWPRLLIDPFLRASRSGLQGSLPSPRPCLSSRRKPTYPPRTSCWHTV